MTRASIFAPTAPVGSGRLVSRRCNLLLIPALLTVLAGCRDLRVRRDVSRCEKNYAAPGGVMVTLIGTEGVRQICQCTIQRVYEQLPDADRQVDRMFAEIADAKEKRGVLGILSDSTSLANRSAELATIVKVYGETLASCSATVVRSGGR